MPGVVGNLHLAGRWIRSNALWSRGHWPARIFASSQTTALPVLGFAWSASPLIFLGGGARSRGAASAAAVLDRASSRSSRAVRVVIAGCSDLPSACSSGTFKSLLNFPCNSPGR